MLLEGLRSRRAQPCAVSRDVISDEAWAVLEPLFPAVKATGRPQIDRRTVVEATAWRFRTGAPVQRLETGRGDVAGGGTATG
ncbi:transposase [Streptomyces sp. NBC_01264]|uniref:transposase n=1 Tax=Streptomyces sp. NBC_01264 TaxID=2903804 RepID=UPI00338F5416